MVRLGYVHFAFLGPESQWAAEASECAGEQGKFWEYHDYLFTHQNGENQGAFSKDNLKGFAAALKLDGARFGQCLDAGKYASVVVAETKSAESIGVQSTPVFIVGGRPLMGAYPFEDFQKLIEAARK